MSGSLIDGLDQMLTVTQRGQPVELRESHASLSINIIEHLMCRFRRAGHNATPATLGIDGAPDRRPS
ncbi:MAG TPA: hypothetical protein VGJ20_33620 [Xanthobacteraceae bacterium]|jgi:hypothetical protein